MIAPGDVDDAIARAKRERDAAPPALRPHFAAVVRLLEQLRDRLTVPSTAEDPPCH